MKSILSRTFFSRASLAAFILQLVVGRSAMAQSAVAGDPKTVIRKIKIAQASIQTLSYDLERTDTFVTGDIRISKGQVRLRTDKKDSLFGFEFEARKEGAGGVTVYAGPIAYETDDKDKSYSVITNPAMLSHLLGNPGGQMVLADLVRLDTSKAIRFETWRDTKYVYLRIHYADLKEYDVIKRSKTLTLDPSTMVPVAMRSHQETLGKVQDLYYLVTAHHINEPSFQDDFVNPGFLATYRQQIPDGKNRPEIVSTGQQAPDFELTAFDGRKVRLSDFRGKTVLLDFWEVWCGPCMESMPKVEHLHDVYKDKGLVVIGITNDLKQLESAKLLVQKKSIPITMLAGNQQLVKDYKVVGVPLYVLIDKSGKIAFVSPGYSPEIEEAIRKESIAWRGGSSNELTPSGFEAAR